MEGWIKLHRRVVDSDIYTMPPLYLRVWHRLILEANHKDKEIPYKTKGAGVIGTKLIKRGERLTSVRQICRWVAWYERGVLKEPNPRTIQTILDWLEGNGMIEIYGEKGNRKETHYNVVKYDIYQGEEEAEVTVTAEVSKQSLQRKVNSDCRQTRMIKNDKEIYTVDFEEFWSTYPGRRIGKKPALKKWQSRLKEGVTAKELTIAAKKYAERCKFEKTEEQYIMRAETFLGPNERWKDWLDWQPPSPQQTMGKDVPGGGVPNAGAYKPVDPEAVRRWKELNKDEYR